jgi:hypothetical protein
VPRSPRTIDKKLLLASLGIAVGIVMIAFAVLRADFTSGDDLYPDAIEDVSPVPRAIQVVGQSQVIVNLASGFEGRLIIDGIELETVPLDEIGRINAEPGEQIDLPPGVLFEPGNATLTFTPDEREPIERFSPGRHEVRVIFWRSVDGPGTARSFNWFFQVA